jgi:Reverse transcriptase (RNA-dependent DNA polymerase)
MEKKGKIAQQQGGFRSHQGCLENVWWVHEVLSDRKNRGLKTYGVFLDVAKAYDTVWHQGLREKLKKEGLACRATRLLMDCGMMG